MNLRKYQREDFDLLNSWVTDEELLFRFAGTAWTFPLDENQILAYQYKFPERQFYLGCDDNNDPFAFGEIIVGDVNSPRLGRLLIGKSADRGKGSGRKFVKMLIEETRRKFDSDILYLYVFEDNFAGIRCYEKAGFKFLEGQSVKFSSNGMDHVALLMIYNMLEKKRLKTSY